MRNWWNSKTTHKRHNWLLLALACCLVAGGMVEVYSWVALVGVVPAGVMVGLEVAG
ncbi:hypothetical protein D3C85_1531520 [compost metagenome]